MLKNKKYLYGDEHIVKVPAHGHYGKYMLHRIRQFGDKDALVIHETGARYTFNQLAQRIVDVALSLSKLGVRKGQTVGMCSQRHLDFLPTGLGIICTGATFAAVDVCCGRATVLHRVNIAKPKIMFCSEDGYKKHREALATVDSLEKIIVFSDQPQEGAILFKDFLTETANVEDFDTEMVDENDITIMLFSSGTTGWPKGIPSTHKNFVVYMDPWTENKYSSRSSILTTREWYHSYGLITTLAALHDGTTIVWSSNNQIEDILAAIGKHRVKILLCSPSTVNEIIKYEGLERFDRTSLEYILSGSTNFQKELLSDVNSKFPNLKMVTQLLGMSEAGAICSDLPSKVGPKPGSVGLPHPGVCIKVADLETREPLGPHQHGELCIRASHLMKRYAGDTSCDKTCPYYDDEGFFLTGDVVYYDEENYVFFVDRIKEMIKFKSHTVSPVEMEAILRLHAAVLDAGVVGAPHAEWGEVPTAFVQLRPGATATEEEILCFVHEQVSYRMRLEGGVRFVPSIPYASSQKLDRKLLKQWAAN